jgi:hypothetical protein
MNAAVPKERTDGEYGCRTFEADARLSLEGIVC